jgi:hypothetical protein
MATVIIDECPVVSIKDTGTPRIVVRDSVPGRPGQNGADAQVPARRHEWASPYDYCAQAPAGSLESAEVWSITRLTIAANGTVVTETATNVAWDDRATATYT